MQVYYSALAFDKPGSLVRSHYRAISPHPLPNVAGHSEVVHAGGVAAIAISRGGDLIASVGNDLLIRIWDDERQDVMEIAVEEHNGGITSMAFSSDGKLLASGSSEGMISVWEVEEERGSNLVVTLAGNGSGVECLAVSDDNKSIICEYKDGTVGIWSLLEKRCVSYSIPILVSLPAATMLENLDPLLITITRHLGWMNR